MEVCIILLHGLVHPRRTGPGRACCHTGRIKPDSALPICPDPHQQVEDGHGPAHLQPTLKTILLQSVVLDESGGTRESETHQTNQT